MFTQKALDAWVSALKNGDVVVAPAEGVYGYCVDPFNAKALQKLLDIKQRDSQKGLICLIENIQQLTQICAPLNTVLQKRIAHYWQGKSKYPTTLILPAHPHLSDLLTGGRQTVAVRFPQTDYMQKYLQAWGGPLVSTSLNIAGAQAVTCAENVPHSVVSLTFKTPLSGEVSHIINAQGVQMR